MQALVTGISGQDGSYLAELLISKGYTVHGLVRRVAIEKERNRLSRIAHLTDKILVHPGSVENYATVIGLIQGFHYDEIYHLAAQSYVAESFTDPFSVMDINVNGTLNLLEAIRLFSPKSRFYFAGSSEMFGEAKEVPQHEFTKFYPRSPYAVSKVAGYELTRNYREAYGLFACNGILFNHESPRRGQEFVTRKISLAAARIKHGADLSPLVLGNMQAQRDWGFAQEYVDAMWRMLQQEYPDDYVIATGKMHSVEGFCDAAFSSVGLNWKEHVTTSPANLRPAEVNLLCGNYERAERKLGWKAKVTMKELAAFMVESDLKQQ